MWDDFLVEGRSGGQQEMTLGDLIQYVKVRPPYSSQQGRHTLSSHPVLLSAYFMHVSVFHLPAVHTMLIVEIDWPFYTY